MFTLLILSFLFAHPGHARSEIIALGAALRGVVQEPVSRGERRLQADVPALRDDWPFPPRTSLSVGAATASHTEVVCQVAVVYENLRIEASTAFNFGLQHSLAKVKLVTAGINRRNCSVTAFDVPSSTGSDLAKGKFLSLSNTQGFSLVSPVSARIKFMHGGFFQLCYAPDGTMNELDSRPALYNNILPAVLKIIGVASSCTSNGCLAEERWHCYFNYRSDTQPDCIIRVSGSEARAGWSMTSGAVSKLSWTSAWPVDTISNGQFVSESPRLCTDTDAEASMLHPTPGDSVGLDFSSGVATMPRVSSSTMSSFTTSVCYCPSYKASGTNPCVQRLDYIQEIGRIYFWTVALCDVSNYDASCSTKYLRVMPQQPFRLRVLCPPGRACASGASKNQFKLIEPSAATALQTWESAQPCQAGTLGSSALIWPSGSEYGGTRVDYKDFHPLRPPRISQTVDSTLEICYCDSQCSLEANWLHVGKVQTVPSFRFASATAVSGGEGIIEYVGKPGGLALYGGPRRDDVLFNDVLPDEYDAPLFSSSALTNFVSYDRLVGSGGHTLEQMLVGETINSKSFQATMDVECGKERYEGLMSGFSSRQEAAEYAAMPTVSAVQFLAFDGAAHNLTTVASKAGILVVCYCAVVDENFGTCKSSDHWLFAGRLTIRGPRGDQTWMVTKSIIFGLAVDGWGLEGSDRLRIIGAGEDCLAGNSTGPEGISEGLLTKCPSVDGSTCEPPDALHELALRGEGPSSAHPSLHIISVATSQTRTTLTFAAGLAGRLKDGDVISLSLDSLLVKGKERTMWTSDEAYSAQTLAGVFEFPDNSSLPDGLPQRRFVGQKVTLVAGTNNQVTIPVGWSQNPGFSFTSNAGTWSKHNKVSTAEELKGTEAQSGLVVCWSAATQGERGERHYARAGTLNIVEPPSMGSAKLSLTTKQRGAVAPVVLSFTTSSVAKEYATTTGPTLLKMVFLDVGDGSGSNPGKLVPKKAGDRRPTGLVPGDFAPDDWVLPSFASQSVCGRFIVELWSNDDGGFPMPQGCYFGERFQDKGSSMHWREFVLKFEAGGGLRHTCKQGGVTKACEYHIVMNAAVMASSSGENLVELYSLCLECSMPYRAIERGKALLATATEAAAGATDLQLRDTGLQLLEVDADGVKTLSTGSTIQFKLFGPSNETRGIPAGAYLRLYLWPLTAWQVAKANCSAACEAHTAPYRSFLCGPAVNCSMEGVLGASAHHQNIVKLTMPSYMDPMWGAVSHSFTVKDLVMPKGGWFPTRFGAQLTSASDNKPSYTTASGFTYKLPEAGTSGRIVVSGRTGQGSKPFVSERDNNIIVRIVLGITLWNAGTSSSTLKLRLKLPQGYICSGSVSTTGSGAVDSTHPLFSIDADKDGYRDHRFSTLSTNAFDGTWNGLHQGSCDYNLAKNMVLFAGSAMIMRVAVNNPGQALSKDAASNQWRVQVFGKGYSTRGAPWSTGATNFITVAESIALGSDLWAANLVVITPLGANQQNLQPTNFERGALQNVQVFFQPMITTGRLGFVVVDAPLGFDFASGGSCQATDLESQYYALPSYPTLATERLDRIAFCTPLQWRTNEGFNRARIQVTRGLKKRTWYGFSVETRNPSAYAASMQTSGWLLWTQDRQGVALEGSPDTRPLRVNPVAYSTFESWGIYNASMSGAQVFFPNNTARPTAMTGTSSTVRFLGITLPSSGSVGLRVTAPNGYTFEKKSGNAPVGFLPRTDGAAADIPGVPTVKDSTELIWSSISFTSGLVYGFEVRMRIPDKHPTTSANAFFIEIGFSQSSMLARSQAAVLPAPAVQSMLNCAVDYVGNMIGYASNYLQFTFQIATTLPSGGGLVITGDTDGFLLACPARSVGSAGHLPHGVRCKVATSPPKVTLTAGWRGISAGLYRFELRNTNPVGAASAGSWTFASFNDTQASTPSKPVDKAAIARGFAIVAAMKSAELVDLTPTQRRMIGRNDRPHQVNALVFSFKLGGDNSAAGGDLQLRGPSGFTFHEDCLPSVVTNLTLVFGLNRSANHSGVYAQWPKNAAPSACTGYGQRAFLTIGSGLAGGSRYVFRIGVRENPTLTPSRNLWSIEFASKASTPFDGFKVWTFTDTQVRASSSAQRIANGTDVLPVALRFRPQNSVPARTGVLLLTAPAGFEFGTLANGNCSTELAATHGKENLVYDKPELTCSVVGNATNRSQLMQMVVRIIGSRPLQANQLHSITASVRNPGAIVPAGEWRLQSFRGSPQSVDTALDDVVVPGFATSPAISQWVVNSTNNELKGTHRAEISFRIAVGNVLMPKDMLAVFAPTGAMMLSKDECSALRWIPSEPSNIIANCPCSSGSPTCVMELNINTTFAKNESFSFSFHMLNPANMPLLVENVWKVEHLRSGRSLASRTMPSWSIQPQLRDLRVLLVGGTMSVGSTSEIQVQFVAVNTAGAIKITAVSPAGFDFNRSFVKEPHKVEQQHRKGPSIVVNTRIQPGRLTSVRIYEVRLAPIGGDTVFSLITMRDSSIGLASKRDELLEFGGGFRLPGRISVKNGNLISLYAKAPKLYPVRYTFQSRVDEPNWAEFALTFSQPVRAGHILKVHNKEYGLHQLHPNDVQLRNSANASLEFNVTQDTQHDLLVKLREDLIDGDSQTYYIAFWATPLGSSHKRFATKSHWRFETEDTARPKYPTNTNDGALWDFTPLQQIRFKIETPRAPPTGLITAKLTFASGTELFGPLVLIAPETFVILQGPCGVDCTVELEGTFPGSARQSVKLSNGTGGPPSTGAPLEIQLALPPVSPSSFVWLLRGLGASGSVEMWGNYSGFPLDIMSGVSMFYNALVGNQDTAVVVSFESRVAGSTEIMLRAPLHYKLFCRTPGSLKQLALPGDNPICIDSFGSTNASEVRELVLQLNGTTLPVGEFAFGVKCDLPVNATLANEVVGIDREWSIATRVGNETIVESKYGIPPLRITNAGVSSPRLAWSKAEADRPSLITTSFSVDKDLEGVDAVLFVFPSRVLHDVRVDGDFRILGTQFPAVVGKERLLLTEMSMLRLQIKADSTIPIGTYRFQFPVVLPSVMPSQNFWHIALCGTATCIKADDQAVVVSFVLAGFSIGERSLIDTAQGEAAGDARRQAPLPKRIIWAAVVFALASLVPIE